VLGSVTEKVLRKAACPVLTVPRRHPDAVPAVPGLFKRILCPIDFSACSMQALDYAMSIAQEADARLTVVAVMTYELVIGPTWSAVAAWKGVTRLGDVRRQEEDVCRRLNDAIPAPVREYGQIETVVPLGSRVAKYSGSPPSSRAS
jgi:nucleotide-binding universal stress UspA family protein